MASTSRPEANCTIEALLAPALAELFQRHPLLQLDLLGHLQLPVVLQCHSDRIRCWPYTDYSSYLNRLGEADIVAAWLEERGITAFVKDELAAQMLPTPMIIAPTGIEVCVAPEHADEARRLLAEHAEELRTHERAPESAEPITAICEDCGEASTFPAAQAGKVQTCPHCRAHMDVPDGD